MALTYSCPKCGRPHMNEAAAYRCCSGGSKDCPACGGKGVIVHFVGPNETCTRCCGTGKVK